MKKLLIFLLVIFVKSLFAQEPDTLKPWNIFGLGSLTINQASFTNWSQGGENSFSGTALMKFYANYKKNSFSIDNNINLKYGVTKNSSESLKKNEDLIEINSQFNHRHNSKWGFSGLINLRTQFDKGYKYPDDSTVISNFFAPAYLTISPGALYKPVKYFSILVSPVTSKTVFVLDQELADLGAFGVDPAEYDTVTNKKIKDGKNVNAKFGAFIELYFLKEILKNVKFESKLNLFYNYLKDNNIPDNAIPLDFNWENFFVFKVNNWLSANLFVHFAYMPGDVFIERTGIDDKKLKVSPNEKLQINQTFGIGLLYNFKNH